MAVRKKLSVKKVSKFILFIISVGVVVFILNMVFNSDNTNPEVKVVDKLDAYGYTLRDNSTTYYKNLFNELKNVLASEAINEENYAKLVAQLFLTDFFTLDNKSNKTDVGGVEFVYDEYQTDFVQFAATSVYKTLTNNITGDRNQTLPVVKNVEVVELEQKEYGYVGATSKYDSKAYFIKLKIEYIEDLEYQENVSIILVHDEDKLVLVDME